MSNDMLDDLEEQMGHFTPEFLDSLVPNRKPPPCGNNDCCVSTGFCDELTFGRGERDYNGYWQFECHTCARAWEENHPEDKGNCFPFEQ